jgi:glycosyltransferase involved in cell wall biosynthesis
MVSFYGGQVHLMAAVSQTIKEKLEKMPEFVRVPAAYLPYGVTMPENVPEPPGNSAPLRILYLGRLSREQKRVQLFPAILEGLKQAAIPCHWTVAGDGPELQWLRENMAGAEAQTLSFAGPVPYSAVPELLAGHNVFLLASDYEGLPLSLLEAMGWGLVPVVSDLKSGISEVVDATNGKRVAPEDVQGYAREIAWLHHHRAELSELSKNARQRVSRDFSAQAMTDRWLNSLPPNLVKPDNWPDHWHPEAPLMLGPGFRFTMPGRFLRRLRLRL